MATTFAGAYPSTAHFVDAIGYITIGYDYDSPLNSFIQAMDSGGMVWEGKDTYKTLEHEERVQGYRRNDHQLCCFKNYTLTYTQYSQAPAKPREGATPQQFAPPTI